jgi:hypothetical protein
MSKYAGNVKINVNLTDVLTASSASPTKVAEFYADLENKLEKMAANPPAGYEVDRAVYEQQLKDLKKERGRLAQLLR